MKNQFLMITVGLVLVHVSFAFGQVKKACELSDVAAINAILGSTLQYDANSIINKNGKYECRYTDPKSTNKYVSVGLLESKIAYGYDLLTSEFTNDEKEISAGNKAVGKYTQFSPFPKAGKNAFYMSGAKDNFSSEAFVFKFRKGDYIVTFGTNDFSKESIIPKIEAIFTLLNSKL